MRSLSIANWIWKCSYLCLKTKLGTYVLYQPLVITVLLYIAETQILLTADSKRLAALT